MNVLEALIHSAFEDDFATTIALLEIPSRSAIHLGEVSN